MPQTDTLLELQALIQARFGDLIQPQELEILREADGLQRIKQLLSERCRRAAAC